MQTFINRTEENNDHTGIIHKIQFRSSFKVALAKKSFTNLSCLSSLKVITKDKHT